MDGEQLPPSSGGLFSVTLLKIWFKMPLRTFLKMHVLYLHSETGPRHLI